MSRPQNNSAARADWQADQLLAKQALEGDQKAAASLRNNYDRLIRATLCKRGASNTEAEDVLADLWADCFGSSGEPLLNKYQGRCALSSWLITVATNRLIDFKRRKSFQQELPEGAVETLPVNRFDQAGDLQPRQKDTALLSVLRDAVSQAFAAEPPETLLMLKLVHMYDVTQREIGRIWNWHESKVSRTLDSARDKIRVAILAQVRRTDPWLTLEWDDFRELATSAPTLISGGSKIEMQKRISS